MPTCFLAPALPARMPRATRACTARTASQMLFRLPNMNPFKSSGGSSGGFRFPGMGSGMGSNMGSGMGSGNGNRGTGRTPGGSGGAADGKNPLLAIWGAYINILESSPIATKACTSLIGFFLGDLIAQKFLGEGTGIDKWRLARMASFGFLIHGPSGHYFYSALDRLIVGATPIKVASKVVIDQLFWAPIFTALFFGYLGLAERKSMDEITKKIKNDTWTGVTTSWKFWPLAHTINFAFIPTSQRLLYINTLQVGYNVILSLLGNK